MWRLFLFLPLLLFAFLLCGAGGSIPKSPLTRVRAFDSRHCLKPCLLALSILIEPNEKARASEISQCSDVLSMLENSSKTQVTLIGTAHISHSSAELVRQTIRRIKPTEVMIELDSKRIGAKREDDLEKAGFDLPKLYRKARSEDLQLSRNFLSGWVKESAGGVLGKALKSFYGNIEKLGFSPGEEFLVAIEEAKACNARILLGDQDVTRTLSNVAAAISDEDPRAFGRLNEKLAIVEGKAGLFSNSANNGELDKESLSVFVENLKSREVFNQVLKTAQEEIPAVYKALVSDRDYFMAESIAGCVESFDGEGALVVVVGLAHLKGIEQYLVARGFKLKKQSC